jgi:protoporphyrinogen oxidase
MAANGLTSDVDWPPALEASAPPEARGLRRDDVRLLVSAPVTGAIPGIELEFLDTIVFNVALRNRQTMSYQWCYFGEPSISFSRLSIPRNFSDGMTPRGADSIVAEVTCRQGDPVWQQPCTLIPSILDDLERVGAARASDVLFVYPERVRESYPVYSLDYRKRLAEIRSRTPGGLTLFGRCGTFWYNNMDHSISQGLAMASGNDVSRDFWKSS